ARCQRNRQIRPTFRDSLRRESAQDPQRQDHAAAAERHCRRSRNERRHLHVGRSGRAQQAERGVMRAIIIGAGRGMRLEQHTQKIPKTMFEVMGRPMLDWIIEALGSAGIRPQDIVFIGGYAEEVVRRAHPEFTFVTNTNWEHNKILLSLMCAREFLHDGFVSTYGDIVYDGEIVKKLVASQHDITLGCDTHWRRRYVNRSRHPESDAEKLRAAGSQVLEISRTIASEAASGEFIGVMKMSAAGARSLAAHF